MNGKATVFVVDEDSDTRHQLAALLAEWEVDVECFASGEDFLGACRWLPRSCAIIDIDLPGMDGLQLQAELSKRGLPLPIVFLTSHGDIPTSVCAIKAGAFDFLVKPASASVLLASIQAALDESEQLSQRASRSQGASALLAGLTEREREVLQLAVEGLANKLIARKLGISYRTVEIHRARIMHKTGAASVLDLAHLVEASPAFLVAPET